MKPSMSIGRNYRLELEKRLRNINKSRENTLSLKILDEQCHLIKPPISFNTDKRKNKKSDVKTKNVKTPAASAGVVPLMVNLSTFTKTLMIIKIMIMCEIF